MLVKIFHVGVAFNPNSQLLLDQAPCPEIFSFAQQDHKLNEIGIIFIPSLAVNLRDKNGIQI